MGVRVREDIKQTLILNSTSHDKKKMKLKEIIVQTQKNFVTEREGDEP